MIKFILMGAALAVLGVMVSLTLASGTDQTAPGHPESDEPKSETAPAAEAKPQEQEQKKAQEEKATGATPRKLATFGGGCFWCVEAVFQQIQGVERVVSGYAGGHVPNPSYQQVLTGLTGHAEVVQIAYDPDRISYPELLEVFWGSHDPTTPNRQGPDVGPQYRSIILYHDAEQREQAEYYKNRLNQTRAFGNLVVTEIVPLEAFYQAEAYHQNYFQRNRRQPYCQLVIEPKLRKVRQVFRDKLKN